MNEIFDNKIVNTENETEDLVHKNTANISLKVIGVGGGGNNAVKYMLQDRFTNVEFIIANTDAQALATNECSHKIPLGKEGRGLGAGSEPRVGETAARESASEIEEQLQGADVVVIAAGFGGGTGTGAAPVIAEIAKKNGALTIGIVTTPFGYEGTKRRKVAREGIEELKKYVDSYIILSNDKLADNYGDMPIDDSFKLSNVSLKNIILSIHDILYRIGSINIDYADVKKILTGAGLTVVGIGQATGNDRATKAVEKAFEQNLYENNIKTAKRMLVNIQYDSKSTINEIRKAVNKVHELLGENQEDDDYDVIIGQEKVQTKDNAEVFKVSIIAGGADINSVATATKTEGPSDLILDNDVITKEVILQDEDFAPEQASVSNITLEEEPTVVEKVVVEQPHVEEKPQPQPVFQEVSYQTESKPEVVIQDDKLISERKKGHFSTIEISSIFDTTSGNGDYSRLYELNPEDDVVDDEDTPW
ncbi:cell division protein FtsZ [Mycoplasmopsis gallopavonis]|uniref:Cell division protein FtsZ n=1 Tax=Mycoplasmopsis gallopavonis TaxID=76629 RepID=A0A449AZ91_9BACT|nr:cell division protein FtsZ [Mycoplasmopsis gallopavonis]RIV16658.1 cell division protein FtsZ [Mycoplasmopsis gallopavonis]VEU72843.1 cell division protein [Mycoplasmopsis gallopavonis]